MKTGKFLLIKREEYLFNELNTVFLRDFTDFFECVEDKLYLTPCLFDNSEEPAYPTISFPSNIDLITLPYKIKEPYGSKIATNFTDDLFWGMSGKWGIYNSHHYWLMVLGYSVELRNKVLHFFGKNEHLVNERYLFSIIKETFYDFKKVSVEQQIEFTNRIKSNNHWISNKFGSQNGYIT